MSFNSCISKEMHLKRKVLLLFLVFLCCNILSVLSTGCDKVATLPKDFQNILPQYEKLKRLHVSNFFFLDDSPGPDVSNTLGGKQEPSNYLKINLSQKSVFKVQITPHHVGIEVNLKINNHDVLLETSPGIPLDFTSYEAINPGVVELWFSVARDEDNQVETELSSKTSHDASCNMPYMKLEVYIEEHQHLGDRLKHIRRETEKLEELSMNLSEMFERVRLEFDTHGESAQEKVIVSKDEKNKNINSDLEAYKLSIPKGSGLQFYRQYNVSVISEFDLNVPDDQIQEASQNSTDSHIPHIINKFMLKMQFYSDFYLGGSYFFMLIRESDIESLVNYDCLNNGKCFISEKPSKNSMLLEAILTPGNYKILLINLNMNFHLEKTSVDIRRHLGIDSIPITARIKVRYFQKSENRFNCEGRHLPQSFDYLMMSNTQSDSYFEYRGDIIMNMNKLHDDVEFSVDEDAVLRLVTFYPHGNNIEISLYQVTENKEFDKLIQHRGNFAMQNLISKILQTVLPHKDHKEEKIETISKNAGESDGLVYPLRKGLRYKLVFNYDSSFFEERDRKFCEMFYLKLAIGKNSYLNKLNSGSCSNSPNFSDIDTLVKNLENNHQKNDEYTYTTPQNLKLEFHAGEMNSIIYSKMVEVKNPINLHIEVISEFITSYIVPIIIPVKQSQISSNTVLNEMLHHKYQKLIFHENTLKLKLNKGKYMLVLMSGLSQLNFSNSANLTPLNINSLLKCMSFKLRVSSLRLTGKKMLNWECNYKHYDEIPSNFGDYLEEKEKYTYFNNNLLLPGFDKQVPFKTMKLKTGSKGYFLRLVAEYSDKNESHKNRYFEVNLYKNGKVIKKAKEYIIDHGMTSDQMFLNYHLKPNTEYEILFEITEREKGWKYFEYCRVFKLEVNMIREDILQIQGNISNSRSNSRDSNSKSSQCVENIPQTQDVIYERLIDVHNSFFKYGTQNAFSMFKSSLQKSNEHKNTNIQDLEVIHPKSSQFTFRFNPEAPTTGKVLKNSFSYDFEVKSLFAKATILIENQSLVGVSAKISSYNNEGSELIAAEDMEGQGLYSIRNLMLSSGKYKITFYVNTHSDKKYNLLLKDQCVSFAATVLLENRPFDYAKRNIGENYETCPYMYLPHDLNIPGWIHADTDYTLNEYMTFRLRDEMKTQRFTIKEKSIFKFHIPTDDGNNLFSYMSLYKYKSKSNNKQKLIEKLEKDSNYMTTILEKGTYMLEFVFSGVGNTSNPGFSKDCNFFDVYMAIIPVSNVSGGIEAFDLNYQNSRCQEQGLPKNNELLPNSFLEFVQMRFSNIADKTLNSGEVHPEMQNVSQNKIFKLLPSASNGKFVAELISNYYTDVMYKFIVFELVEKKGNKVHVEVPIELIKHENYMWVTFHFDKHKEYALEILSANFDVHSVCSDVVFSYNYEEYANNTDMKNDTEEEYLTKKDTCKVDDHLPLNFFDNYSNHLDRYGGPQSEVNGEINFLGEFLLPKSSTILRSEFAIRTKSVVFVKLIPKYTHVQVSNVQIQIYQDKKMMFSYHHSDHNGILIAELDITSVYNAETKQYENSKATPYFLQLVFDRVLTECETFELIFSIIPRDVYTGEYLACDQERQKLPESLSFEKTSQFIFSSLLQPKVDPEFKVDENDSSILVKNIKLVLTKATTLTLELEYITSDNYMDIELLHDPLSQQEGFTDEILELGKESTHPAPQLKGITSKKEINVNLKKGHYILRVVYHKFFSDLLKKHFEREYQDNSFCLGFDLRIEGVVLKNLKRDSQDEKDDDETNPELDHLQKKDFTSNFQNIITSIEPASLKEIKLESGFDLEIKFAYPFENQNSTENEIKHMKMIYLQDINNQSGRKIFPHELLEMDKSSIKFNFQVNSHNFFEMTKCYKLHIDDSFKNVYDSEAIESLNHIYCLEHCECYSMSNYKCAKNGKCICYSPYTGAKCNECVKGYMKNSLGRCVDEQLENSKCEDKITCSGHGTCTEKNYDAYSITSKNKNGPCKCNDNYSSYNSPAGFPSQNFCNTCTNPSKVFPLCGEKLGEESDDALTFNLESSCNESQEGSSLPMSLFDNSDPEEESEMEDPVLASLGGGQQNDGSLDLLAVFLVKKPEETSKLFIPEESLVRVFYESHEINRAKVMIFKNKNDQEAIAYTEGKDKTESFIVKLDAKNSPYYLKIMHINMKYGCNRYRLKIVISPMRLAMSALKCQSSIQDTNNLLPPQNILIDSSTVHGMEKVYILPDHLVLNVNNTSTSSHIDYSQSGVLTKAKYDEEFIYNINLDVKNPVSFSSNVLFDFLTSDFSLVLRESNGKIIKSGDWLIPDATVHVSDHDFINGLQTILDPGRYYLTLVQNVPANHLLQLIHETEKEKKKSHIPRCFKFNLHIQTSVINKPDSSISTAKFESMYNRIVSVEPESISNLNVNQKFEIFVTFEDSISTSTKSQKFKNVFYLENSRTHEKIPADHVYLQGSLAKTFAIIYEENKLIKDDCYELKFDLDILISANDKDRKIMSDSPIVHKFCTKSCNCNPHTTFECDSNSRCICEEPYTGEGCFSCIEGWFPARGKCISESNCKINFCSDHGHCINDNSYTQSSVKLPTCRCQTGFTGKDCSKCENSNDVFPDCVKVDQVGKNVENFDSFLKTEQEEVNELDIDRNRCAHAFVPHNLDSLGYLHLDGNMHISGKYSLKHINNKHYSMIFTIKERSHVKLFMEHSKYTHMINIFLLDNSKKHLLNGNIHVGPAGMGSASSIDFVVDPIKNSDNTYAHYELALFIKDLPTEEGDTIMSYAEDSEIKNLTDECFTIFLEMQVMTATKESLMLTSILNEHQCQQKIEKLPTLIPPNVNLLDYHTVFYNSIEQTMTKYTHIRNSINQTGVNYFHYEYFYVPDHLDRELILELEVYSKFINSHVGILLEIVEIPTTLKIDHKKLNARKLQEIVEKSHKRLESPDCTIHCFTAIKKFNSVLLSRVLPSDTFFRIWFYDVSPLMKNLVPGGGSSPTSCVNFEVLLNLKNAKTDDKSLRTKREAALCLVPSLPKNLNVKGFLGDSRYLEKWGFHLLDNFRIDDTLQTGLVHETTFEIKEYHMLRMVVFHGRVDTDLELFSRSPNNEEILIAMSNSKNFEDALVMEIPPGHYKIVFKFFPPSTGFHKCESIRMEFSMDKFTNLQSNIDRMVARHQNSPKFEKIDMLEILSSSSSNVNIFEKDSVSRRYSIKLSEPFNINKDDTKNYESSISISEITFVIEPEDSGKVEIISYINSDFLYLDANIYLSYLPSNQDKTKSKIISGIHKKNMNLLSTGALESGTYILSIRYYRRLHFSGNDHSKDVQLFRATFGEIEFDSMLVNRSASDVSILTSDGYLKLPPYNDNKTSVTHNWLCRHAGSPLPKSLSNLRYLEFNPDSHILDTFLVPPMGVGEEVIKFRLKFSVNTMIRVYVECHHTDIDLELREVTSHSEYKVIAASKENIHFETIMQIISDEKEYEIVLKFNGKGENSSNSSESHMSISDPSQSCQTFKMEIALEKSHNYACPNNGKYALLTDIKPIPEVLPVKSKDNKNQSRIYKYDSRNTYLGDEKGSGYVYLLRSQSDKVIEYSTFNVESDIDFKIEIENDFMQAPVNIFLTSSNPDHKHLQSNNMNLAHNALQLQDGFIVSYGEIFENRTVMLIKDLPKGTYTVYLYLPGLKTRFINEPRVCSIYDILVEIKKSRNHFKLKEIVDTSEIRETNLDIPTTLPTSLSSLKYLENDENYINFFTDVFLRKNITTTEGENYDLYNTITFSISEESLVEFYVSHDQLKEKLQVAVEGFSNFAEYSTTVLKPGKYKAVIKIENPKNRIHIEGKPDTDDIFHISSLDHAIQFYVGISPLKRVSEIYNYNNIQSSYHQCKTMTLPNKLDQEPETGIYNYHTDFFTFNKADVRNLKLGQFTQHLTSNNNRILVEIGGDYVLNKLSMVIKSENKTWKTMWYHNIGDLDIIVPKGTYTFELELEERIFLNNLDCIIFSMDIHIIDMDSKIITSGQDHPLYHSHMFDSAHTKSRLLKPTCEGTVLPIELHRNADEDYHKIKENGDYLLHINKATYFNSKQHTKDGENLNEVDINLHMSSLIHITTTVEKPNEFQIIPKMKFYNKNLPLDDNNYRMPTEMEFISHSLKERNTIWFLDANKSTSDEYFTLELLQEKYEELSEASHSFHCPVYGLDILIQSLAEIVNKLQCIQKSDNEVMQYILPKKNIPVFKATSTSPYVKNNNNYSYHEKIKFTYFTEQQYGDNFLESEMFNGLQYKIEIEIEDNEYYLSLELGFDQVVSLFDVFLSKHEENDAFSSRVIEVSNPYFDNYDKNFPYKRILTAKLSKGKYVLVLAEELWNDINVNVRSRAGLEESKKLCLPFSYSIDIVPANHVSAPAEILSVFPPGPLAFKSAEEDLKVSIVLSKPAFTRKHEAITYTENFMNIINAFYLVKSPTQGKTGKTAINFNEPGTQNKIHPSKLEGSENNMQWTLLFLGEHFEPHFDYELHLDGTWLQDVSYVEFKIPSNIKMPIFRVETQKEQIVEFVDSIQKMKNELNEADMTVQKDEALKSGQTPPPAKITPAQSKSKCGEHGKLIYDNILKKQVCTCLDGFSGKFCQVCEGVYDKKSNKCIIKEEDTDEDGEESLEPISESISQHIKPANPVSQTPQYVPQKTQDYKSCEGGCVNGYCDSKTGRCVCDIEFTGPRCDRKKTITGNVKIQTLPSEESAGYMHILINLIIAVALITILLFLYKILKRMIEEKPKNKEYEAIPLNEFEMSLGSHSINSALDNNDLDLISDNQNLVDYEIKTESKYKRPKKGKSDYNEL